MVVRPVVSTISQAKPCGSEAFKGPAGRAGSNLLIIPIRDVAADDCKNSEMTAEAHIALISDHAFTRHQNQRNMNTSPAPAPIEIKNFHAPWIDSICVDARTAPTVTRIVATRAART